MAGPRDPQDSPSLRCHGNAAIFIPLFMMLKALTFSVPERGQAVFCPHPSLQHLLPEAWQGKAEWRKQKPAGSPLNQGTV